MSRMTAIGRPLHEAPTDDYTEAQCEWLDLLSAEEYALLARTFFSLHKHHAAWEAFMRDTASDFELATKRSREV